MCYAYIRFCIPNFASLYYISLREPGFSVDIFARQPFIAAQYLVDSGLSKFVLTDGKQLAKLMIEYDLGVSTVATYKVKRVDSDFLMKMYNNSYEM